MLWPESSHKPLLRATFLSGEEALSAWKEWQALVNLDDDPDSGSFRLLPHLFHNLRDLQVNDPFMMRLRGIARKNWVNNQRTLSIRSRLLPAFAEQGIDFILLPGAATAVQYYPDYTLVPPAEIALLIRPHALQTAVHLLQISGWHLEREMSSTQIEAITLSQPALHLSGPDGLYLRLHWRTVGGNCASQIDESLWTGAEAIPDQDTLMQVLNPTDHLLWTAALGLPQALEPLFVRVVESMLVLKAASAIDWPRLVTQAQRRWQRVPLLEVLQYLQESLGIDLPQNLLKDLRESPLYAAEKRAYNFDYLAAKGWRKGVALWYLHSQCNNSTNLGRSVLSFPRYLQKTWRLRSLWQVPIHALAVMVRRLTKAWPKR